MLVMYKGLLVQGGLKDHPQMHFPSKHEVQKLSLGDVSQPPELSGKSLTFTALSAAIYSYRQKKRTP